VMGPVLLKPKTRAGIGARISLGVASLVLVDTVAVTERERETGRISDLNWCVRSTTINRLLASRSNVGYQRRLHVVDRITVRLGRRDT